MKKGILLILVALLFGGVMGQDKIYMPYFETINMHKEYQKSASRLLKTYIELENKVELVFPEADTSYYSEDKDAAIQKAKSLQIQYVLIGELNRVGETVVVSVNLYKSENGERIWSTLQKALSPDDLDPIMQIIASEAVSRGPHGSSDDIYNVTNYNSKQLNRINATTYWGIEIGGGTTFLNASNNFPAGFGLMYSGDLRTIIFDVKGSMYFSDVNLLNMSIHINYPLWKKISSPYFGGGLGYGSTILEKSNPSKNYSGSGLTLYGGGGYVFNRTSNINLRVNANMFFSMYEVKGSYPAGILMGVMVLF